jgi:hypothetical protein
MIRRPPLPNGASTAAVGVTAIAARTLGAEDDDR